MRERWIRSALLGPVLALAGALPAWGHGAGTQMFNDGSLIFPVDNCYARISGSGGADAAVDFVIQPSTQAELGCNASAEGDAGAIQVYGLMSKFLTASPAIPVHWIIKPSKGWDVTDHGFHEVDLSLPNTDVERLTYGTTAQDRDYSSFTTGPFVQYRGGVFVVEAADAASAIAIMAAESAYDEVDVHRAKVAFTASVFTELTAMPKLGILDVNSGSEFGGGDMGDLTAALNLAGMGYGSGSWWFTVTAAELRADDLQSNGITLLWVPNFTSIAAANRAADLAALDRFLSWPGHAVFHGSAVATMESDPTDGWNPREHSPTTLDVTGLGGSYGATIGTELVCSSDYSDPLGQVGGFAWTANGMGNTFEWQPTGGAGAYNAGVNRVVTACLGGVLDTDPQDGWDIASWRFYENDNAQGKVVYLGGQTWSASTPSPLQVLLNSIFMTPTTPPETPPEITEASRSSPVIDVIEGTNTFFGGTMDIEDPAVAAAFTSYQGLPSAATFRFPLVVGHMRGIAAASIGSAQTFDSVTAIFDADTWLRNLGAPPGPVNNRKIFTSSGAGYRPSKVAFTPGNAASLAASLSRPAPAVAWTDDEAEGLIERVYAGWRSITGSSSIQYRARLGGVDRSSLVVVGDSPVVGGDRPTVIYFGATDGMIHAVCANDTVLVSPCTTAGQELWAYLPPNQLGLLWNNTQRIDGQPLAMDVFGNFDNSSDGTREWKTLLVFQSGNPNGTSSAYALDISDPTEASVSVMWERPLAGVGLGVAAGPVRKGTFVVYSGFFLTNNGTGNPAGIKALALDLVDGSYNAATNADEIATRGWSFSRDYPIGARSLTAGDLVVLATGIPEGLAAVDLSDDQSITHVVFPTLTGEIYKVDAKSVGAIPAGLLPFASIEENYHPLGFSPAIFREVDGQFYAVFGTGGYVDPVAASWYQTSTDQFMFGVLLDDQAVSSTNVVQLPNMLTSVAGGATGVAFRRNLGTDQRVFGSVTRIGDSLFVTADSQDANLATYGVSGGGTAKLYQTRIDSGDNVTFTAEVNVVAGANTPKVIGGEVKVAGATQIESVNATIGGGRHADIKYEMWNIRRLWLKTQ